MPENEFEKQVQQKMDSLKVKPSAEVWQNVADAITKRKSDRRIIAFIFLALFLSVAGIFIYTSNTKNNQHLADKMLPVKAHPAATDAVKNLNPTTADDVENSKLYKKDTVTDQAKMLQDIKGKKEIANQQKTTPQLHSVKLVSSTKEEKIINTNSIAVTDAIHNGNKKLQYKKKQQLSLKVSNGAIADDLNETPLVNSSTEQTIASTNDSSENTVDVKEIILKPVIKNTIDSSETASRITTPVIAANNKNKTIEKKSKQTKQKNNWQFGFNFSSGITTTQNGYLGVIGAGNGDGSKSYRSADLVQAAPNNGQPGYTVYHPSKINAGAGITAGIFMQKNISKNTSIVLGLNYKTYSSVMMVGYKVDSVLYGSSNYALNSADRIFYRSGADRKYKNHFHFIELPLAVHIKLTNKNKPAVYLNAGIAIAQFIGSNALQFDTASGKYYRNNNMLNKTQANISAALLFALSRHAKNPFLIGPDINIGLKKIAQSGLYSNRRYSFFGLRVQKNMGKK